MERWRMGPLGLGMMLWRMLRDGMRLVVHLCAWEPNIQSAWFMNEVIPTCQEHFCSQARASVSATLFSLNVDMTLSTVRAIHTPYLRPSRTAHTLHLCECYQTRSQHSTPSSPDPRSSSTLGGIRRRSRLRVRRRA